RVVGLGIGFQHVLHGRHKFAVRLGRNDPVLELALRHAVFLSVLRKVSWLIFSTMPNSTTLSANKRSDQLANPFGGLPKRTAMTFASCSPSRILARGGVAGLLAWSVSSKPSVTSRCRIFSTVLVRQPNASAICRSVQFGPSASHFSSTCALRTFIDDPFKPRITSRSICRSCSVKRTTYFFCMAILLDGPPS